MVTNESSYRTCCPPMRGGRPHHSPLPNILLLQITLRPPPGTGWDMAGESELVVAVFEDNNKSGHYVC